MDVDDVKLFFLNGDGFWMENGVFFDCKKDLFKDFYLMRNFIDKFINIMENCDEEVKVKLFFGYFVYIVFYWFF